MDINSHVQCKRSLIWWIVQFITSIKLDVNVYFIKIHLEISAIPTHLLTIPNMFNLVFVLTQKGADEDENLNGGGEIFVGSFLHV